MPQTRPRLHLVEPLHIDIKFWDIIVMSSQSKPSMHKLPRTVPRYIHVKICLLTFNRWRFGVTKTIFAFLFVTSLQAMAVFAPLLVPAMPPAHPSRALIGTAVSLLSTALFSGNTIPLCRHSGRRKYHKSTPGLARLPSITSQSGYLARFSGGWAVHAWWGRSRDSSYTHKVPCFPGFIAPETYCTCLSCKISSLTAHRM